MISLIEKLKAIASRADNSDAPALKEAIDHIQEMEDKLSDYEEDITDWQMSVKKQMGREDDT